MRIKVYTHSPFTEIVRAMIIREKKESTRRKISYLKNKNGSKPLA